MSTADWWVVGVYLAAMLALAAALGRSNKSRQDYYLAGSDLPPAALATSILATQCSTNSLLGAPAFVGFSIAGGLVWLQYELAVPLAMLALTLLFPAIHRSGVISIYAFLEQRLGREVRLTASACFLFFRGVATGVTVYGVASVLALVTGLNYLSAVLLFMGVTIAYDVMGGMRAVVISDVVQMLLLVTAVAVSLVALGPLLGDFSAELALRRETLFLDWGFSGNGNFGLWPMLFGGLFLYVAYYGCDQSQAQRLLAAKDQRALNRILLLNGVLRFPLVLAYCFLGLGLAAYGLEHSDFVASLPRTEGGSPNVNLAFPAYVLREFAPGLAGLAIVGLFAAAMSSVDSALNSLSAATVEDFLPPGDKEHPVRLSRVVTLGWGSFAVGFSFFVEHIASTILEAINKIGSVANGPLLALFIIAVLRPGTPGKVVLGGFGIGLAVNLGLWRGAPQVSWLWWNPAGCIAALAATLLLATALPAGSAVVAPPEAVKSPDRRSVQVMLLMAFLAMATMLVLM